MTLDNGQSLSPGSSPVAVEDSSTLLENVISTMDEFSYVYDDENRETVYKTMIDKMFAIMSDRSSVNKQFNEDLDKHRKDILDSIVMHISYWVFHINVNQYCSNLRNS